MNSLQEDDTAQARAVIYCRTASVMRTEDTTVDERLAAQEQCCRDYADARGYPVVAVFREQASGTTLERTGVQEMLAFLRENRDAPLVVIIDDISRLARSVVMHLQLREAITSAGATLVSPQFLAGGDAESRFIEHTMAAVAELHDAQEKATEHEG